MVDLLKTDDIEPLRFDVVADDREIEVNVSSRRDVVRAEFQREEIFLLFFFLGLLFCSLLRRRFGRLFGLGRYL